MAEQLRQLFSFGGRIVDFHPVLNPDCRQDNVLWAHNGFCNPVAGFFQKGANRDAPAAAGVIVSVIRENHNLQIASLPGLVTGAQILKLFIEHAEHGEDVAVQMLGIVRRTNIDIVAGLLARGVPKVFGQSVQFIFVCVQRIDVTHRPHDAVLHLPVHLPFMLHRGGDAVDGNYRVRRRAEISALITGQGAVAENFGPRDIAGGWKRRDHAADWKVSLSRTERLTLERPSPEIRAGDSCLQRLQVAIRDSVQRQNQSCGERAAC